MLSLGICCTVLALKTEKRIKHMFRSNPDNAPPRQKQFLESHLTSNLSIGFYKQGFKTVKI